MAGKIRSRAEEAFENALIKKAAPLIEKWNGALNSDKAPAIENAVERYAMAVMLENTQRELSVMAEAGQTTTVLGSAYVPTMLGMIRQIFPRLIGKDLVGIQPLDRPSGKVFKLDLKRDDDSDPADHSNWNTSRTYADHSGGELGDIQKGMKIALTSSDVAIGTPKKLLTEASIELLQDLRAYHQLDASDLLQGAAVDEIAREIDAVLVKLVRDAAIANHTTTFGAAPAGYPVEKWPARLQRAILNANNAIYTNRGVDGTWLLAGTNAALELMDLNSFVLDPSFNGENAGYGIQRTGTVSGQFNVFRCRYVNADEIIVGRKGTSILDAGAFWLPYVPLFVSERVFDPTTQGIRQSFMSRYGTHVASNQYFARVLLDENATGIS